MTAKRMSRFVAGNIISMIVRSPEGISMARIASALGVDVSTVKRNVALLKQEFRAPISSSRRGYHWRPSREEQDRAEALIMVFCESRRDAARHLYSESGIAAVH